MSRLELELAASDFHIDLKSYHESLAEFLFKDNNPCLFIFEYATHNNISDNRFMFFNGYRAGIPIMCPNYAKEKYKNYKWPNNIYTETPEALNYYLENHILNYNPNYKEFGPCMIIETQVDGAPYTLIRFKLYLYRGNRFRLLSRHLEFYWQLLEALEPVINITFKNKRRFNNEFRLDV